MVILVALALTLDEQSSVREVMFMFVLPMILLTITLLRIAYKTGEKPERRRGTKRTKNSESKEHN